MNITQLTNKPSKIRRWMVACGLSSIAIGIGFYDWRLSAIVMGVIITLAGMEII